MKYKLKNVQELRNEGISIPDYLAHDINALIDGKEKDVLYLDCLIDECYGSINMALVSDKMITAEQADYLRSLYC
ncbi:hypothetical protein CLFO_35180 [Clostridium formicaceticum]|uniref:Uncharacterized protein n=2 Tax=Clostridium formicaceticum TaxID=1497 RepID=A0AAC9WHG9_9CLOT|nr:hypothetical protein [Clostridium formicaceticum]AOY74726.1 hypothetical protein BJL90_01410 [Clostridium formicaceticum]ARE89112.1 hypothetical protein CLFO_35180 [Clostridium formicaceticum]